MKTVPAKSPNTLITTERTRLSTFGTAISGTEIAALRQTMSRYSDTGGLALSNALLSRLIVLRRIRSELEKRLSVAPSEQFSIKKNHDKTTFYKKKPGSANKLVYLSKSDIDELAALINKEYDTRLLKVVEFEISILEKTAAALGITSEIEPGTTELQNGCEVTHSVTENSVVSSIETVVDTFPEICHQYIMPVAIPDEYYADAWQHQPYVPLSFNDSDYTDFYTERGERVRSKSEQIIANALTRNGIPYRYECPMKLSGKQIYPDFTVLNPHTREVFYWEHFGMMDDRDYAEKAVRKINTYASEGFVPGKNLIITCETGSNPLGSGVIEMTIKKYLIK